MPDVPVEPNTPPAPDVEPEYPTNLPYVTIGNGFAGPDMRQILIRDADSSAEYGQRSLSRINHISIHHWAGPELDVETADQEYQRLLSIRDFHRYSNGWPGYAYHFTIFPSGRIYYTGAMDTLRYVVKDQNGESLAIAYAGNFMRVPPTAVALRSGRKLIGELNFELDTIRRLRKFFPVLGHKEVHGTDPTACPGDTWPQWQQELFLAEPALPAPSSGYDDGTEQGANIVRALSYAALWEVDGRYVLGGTIAEAALLSANRRPKDPNKDRIAWPDVSEGALQQTVAYSVEYLDEGGDPEAYPGAATTERILALYRDPEHAFQNAMPQLREKWKEADGDALNALCLYNSPYGYEPEDNPNRRGYARGLRCADRILAGEHWRTVLETEPW